MQHLMSLAFPKEKTIHFLDIKSKIHESVRVTTVFRNAQLILVLAAEGADHITSAYKAFGGVEGSVQATWTASYCAEVPKIPPYQLATFINAVGADFKHVHVEGSTLGSLMLWAPTEKGLQKILVSAGMSEQEAKDSIVSVGDMPCIL